MLISFVLLFGIFGCRAYANTPDEQADAQGENYLTSQKLYALVMVNGPVDVLVYDDEGALIGKIKNEKAIEMPGVITMNSEKGQIYVSKIRAKRIC